MYQIDNSTAATTQPASTAAGTAGFFTDGNPATSTPATIVPAEWLNSVMLELLNVVTGSGITASKSTFNQVLSAIKRLGQKSVVLTDTGAANAYTATNSPALVAGDLVSGLIQQITIAHANTGASTYAPDGLTSAPIYGLGLQPLQGGELALGGTAVLMRATIAGVNSGNPIWVLMECAGGAQQIAPATQSQHAVQLGQVRGAQQLITSSTTFTVPTGVTTIYATVIGGGAGGGGSGSAAGNTTTSGAGGGGGGGSAGNTIYKQAITVAPGQVLTATIGALGTGGTGSSGIGTNATSGNNGGTTTLTGTSPTVSLSASGGTGGGPGAFANGTSTTSVGAGGQGGGVSASSGTFGQAQANVAVGGYGGQGGSTNLGQGGGAPRSPGGISAGIAGNNGSGLGAGGSGATGACALLTGTTQGGANGGNGTAGAILLEW